MIERVLFYLGCFMFGAGITLLYSRVRRWWINRTKPQGVRLVLENGETVTLTCRYRGRNEAGHRLWLAEVPVGPLEMETAHLQVDLLPARTELDFRLVPTS